MGSKYPVLKPQEVISALSKAGFVFQKQRGSHAKYTSGSKTVIIPMHDEIAKGTLKSILTQAGIELEQFLELLHS